MASTRTWTEEDSSLVRQLVAAGATRRQIAAAIGCSLTTLRRRFGDELATHDPSSESGAALGTPQSLHFFAGLGVTPGQIAALHGAAEGQIEQAFGMQLSAARSWLDAIVGGGLLKNALLEGETAAQVQWLKARGWQDRVRAETEAAEQSHASDESLRETMEKLSPRGRAAMEVVLRELGAKSSLPDDGPRFEDMDT